jgi:3-oxoadipate enol-lactonase
MAPELFLEDRGDGRPVVLLHGLTATHRYVVMGSRHLERHGCRVVAYDARGHGASAPAADGYGYDRLADDLVELLDVLGLDRAVLAGASMGAHTALRVALRAPERVAGLVVVTPAFDPGADPDEGWDRLADGLESGGVEGFVAAYDASRLQPAFRETVIKVLRQRLALHQHPAAIVRALREVPRSRPFEAWDELGAIAVPTAVVASRDEADPGHPLAIGQRYAQLIPAATLHVEQEGRSPLAWQGGQLSRVIEDLAGKALPA